MIVNPWGEVLTQLTTGNGFVQADFERNELINTRTKMPIQQHNRFNSIQKLK